LCWYEIAPIVSIPVLARVSLFFKRDGLNRYPMEFTLARQKHGEFADMKAGAYLSDTCL